jgi:hypothetical protein
MDRRSFLLGTGAALLMPTPHAAASYRFSSVSIGKPNIDRFLIVGAPGYSSVSVAGRPLDQVLPGMFRLR